MSLMQGSQSKTPTVIHNITIVSMVMTHIARFEIIDGDVLAVRLEATS